MKIANQFPSKEESDEYRRSLFYTRNHQMIITAHFPIQGTIRWRLQTTLRIKEAKDDHCRSLSHTRNHQINIADHFTIQNATDDNDIECDAVGCSAPLGESKKSNLSNAIKIEIGSPLCCHHDRHWKSCPMRTRGEAKDSHYRSFAAQILREKFAPSWSPAWLCECGAQLQQAHRIFPPDTVCSLL